MFHQIKRWFITQFTDKCPNCGDLLDDDVHGYGHKYNHCHNCGYCTNTGCRVTI